MASNPRRRYNRYNRLMLNRNSRGFAIIEVLLVVAVLVIIGLIGWRLLGSRQSTGKTPEQISDDESGKCQGKGTVPLTASPIALDQLDSIAPMGNMVGDHVTPSDHLGFASKTPDKDTPIRAMAKGFIVNITYTKEPSKTWYSLQIEHSCTFYSTQFLVSDITPALKSAMKGQDSVEVRIPVEAGEVIGSLKGHGMDYLLVDLNSTIPFVNPERYANQAHKVHIVDPFPYFSEPLKTQLLAKNLRQYPPPGGVISYDIAGTLAGNWFKAGFKPSNDATDAASELTLGYDFLDPRIVRISIGDYQGKATQFSPSGNSPDPKSVKVGQTIKYGLAGLDYTVPGGGRWDRKSVVVGLTGKINEGQLAGTMLIELTSERQLRLETFPGKKPAEVSGFTSAALVYER